MKRHPYRLFLPIFAAILLHPPSASAQVGYWTTQWIPPLPTYRAFDMVDASNGIAVGPSFIDPVPQIGYSGVLTTSDGGANWWALASGTPQFDPALPLWTVWNAVQWVDQRTIYVAGDSGLIYKSIDAGNTYLKCGNLPKPPHWHTRVTIRGMSFISDMMGIVVGGDVWTSKGEIHPAQAYLTVDGGRTWVNISPSLNLLQGQEGAFLDITNDGSTWYACGEFGLVMSFDVTNGWQYVQVFNHPSIFTYRFTDIQAVAPSMYFFSGENTAAQKPVLYKVIRNGTRVAEFTPANVPATVKSIPALFFTDSLYGFIGATSQYLANTTDQGVQWFPYAAINTSTAPAVVQMDFIDRLNGWALVDDGSGYAPYILRYYGVPPKSDISTSDPSLTFPNVTCERSVESTYTLRNSGTGDLYINAGGISFSSPDFELVGVTYPIRILPKKFKTITVRWHPDRSLSGPLNATMTIASNDPDHNPWTVTLNGTRFAGQLEIPPAITVSYGLCLGETATMSVPIDPTGNRTPTFIAFEFVTGRNEFRLLSPQPGTDIKSTTDFVFRFAPADSGLRKGLYRFVHGNPACPDTSYCELSGLSQVTILRPSVTTIDFGDVCVGAIRDTVIQLKNHGNYFAYTTAFTRESGDDVFFSNDYITVSPDSVKPYHISFSPVKSGAVTAVYRTANGACPDTTRITLKGRGISTEVSFTPKSPVRLPSLFVNNVATQQVTITNTGLTPARVTRVSLMPQYPALQITNPPAVPQTLNPGQSISVTLRFEPKKVGDYTSVLRVDWDSRCADSGICVISAQCIPNPLIEAPTAINVGVQSCDAPRIDTSRIYNRGNGPLVFFSTAVVGADAAHFTILRPKMGDTVRAYDSIPFIIQYARPTEGSSQAVLRLTHNDYSNNNGRLDVAVVGLRTVTAYAVEGDSATPFFTRLFVPETRVFTIRNTSRFPLTITGLSVVRAATVFSVSPDTPLPVSLGPGATLPFTVTFTPNARGPFNGAVQVVSQPCGYTWVLSLTGSGDTEGLTPDKGELVYELDPCTYTPACDKVTLKNLGTESVSVLSVTITPAGGVFTLNPAVSTPFPVAPGAEKELTVCVSPSLRGSAQGSLVITSNDPVYPSFTIPLQAHRDSSNVALSTEAVNFGRLAPCMQPETKRVSVTNTGTLPEVLNAAFTDGTAFATTFVSPQTLAPGKTYAFDVTFTRPANGVFNDVLIIRTDRCMQELHLSLTAESVDASYAVTPSPLNFPTVSVGASDTRQLLLTNTGGFDATVAGVYVQPSGDFTAVGSWPSPLAAGAQMGIDVRFSPQGEGVRQATVCIVISSPCLDTICVDVNGTGVRGALSVRPTSLQFGTLAQCESAQRSDTLVNNGSGQVMVLGADITGPGAAAYTNGAPVVSPEPLAPGGTRVFPITFTAALAPADGPVTATLSIRTDDPTVPVIDVPLNGTRVTMTADPGGSIAFGTVETGVPVQRSITIRNTGSARLCYADAALPAGVTISPLPPFCIEPGQSAPVTVTLTPGVPGNWNGRLVFHAPTPCEDSTVYTLTATVQQGSLTQTPTVTLGSDAWCATRSFDVQITNQYLEVVNLESLTFTGADARFFRVTSPTSFPRPIAAGSSLTVTCEFTPEQADRSYATELVSAFSTTTGPAERRTAVTAASMVPTLRVDDASWPAIVVGQSGSTQAVTITNTSSLPVHVASALPSNGAFVITGVNPPIPATLQPGGTITVSVQFRPVVVGSFTDSLVVSADAPCAAGAHGLLVGTGIAQPYVDAVLSADTVGGKVDDLVRIRILCDKSLTGASVISWTGTIAFNPTMLYPVRVVTEGTMSQAMTGSVTYDPATGHATLTVSGGAATGGPGVLAELECRVLIGNAETTPVDLLSDFSFTTGYARVSGRQSGSFTLTGYCKPDDRLVRESARLAITQSHPNPLSLGSRSTALASYLLPTDAEVNLEVVDLMGRTVRTLVRSAQKAGMHDVSIPVDGLAPGVYQLVLRAQGGVATRRMVLVD